MALENQIQILSVDTGNFYYDDEAALHERNRFVRVERRKLINGFIEQDENGKPIHHEGTKELLTKLNKLGVSEKMANAFCNQDVDVSEYNSEILNLLNSYNESYQKIKALATEAKETKEELLNLLKSRVEFNISQDEQNRKIRELRENTLISSQDKIYDKNIVSVFESSFTRMIGAEIDKFTDAFMVVQVYYFDIIKDLIYHGFMYKDEHYIYFTSSAGQIRTKKTVFIKESIWKQYEKTIMCGLSIDLINAMGGNNPNKHLAYMALANSATDLWSEFDIDKTIVVDDFETQVYGTYDFVDDIDFSITRVSDYIPITHTDGAGMILPNAFGKQQRNKMIRLPWIKGLLGVFDFKKFIQTNNCSSIIKDIYDVEHDVIAEDIQIIFTKSQFKMYKFYKNWQSYKDNYKKYNCTAGYTNEEERRIKNSTINYQMLQTLTDITPDEIVAISKKSADKLINMCSSIEDIQGVFGATVYNTDQTAFQKAITIYPELLNDPYIRIKLKRVKDSLLKRYYSGKLEIYGKYTFILPDFYAACQFWFQHIDIPEGLLKDGEVFCWLFRKDNKLDCLRSPHLYREHCVRRNVACQEFDEQQKQFREWFGTDAIYTSSHDLISKVLQFDVDGDKSLVVADKNIVSVAERNMKGIVPLYYNMRKASPSELTNETIYNGLIAAFTGGNIGIYSNNISKIWNNDVFINGTNDEQQHALDCIKRLCCQNNFVIDYAKTLYKPEFPDKIKKEIKEFTKTAVPYFFKFAKDKEEWQITERNGSFINQIYNKIPNPRISCRYISIDGKGKKLLRPNYRLLMSDESFNITEEHMPLIEKYIELSKKYYYKLDYIVTKHINPEVLRKSQLRQNITYKNISQETLYELSLFGYSDVEIVDILVKYLYNIKEAKYKDLLWTCYGEIILNNLIAYSKDKRFYNNFIHTRDVQCVDCGEWFKVNKKAAKVTRCNECQKRYRLNVINHNAKVYYYNHK